MIAAGAPSQTQLRPTPRITKSFNICGTAAIIDRDGEPLKGYDSYRTAWACALDHAGLQNVLLDEVRHTAANNRLSAGIDPATVCLTVGWRSKQTMMRCVQLPGSRLEAAGKEAEAWLSTARAEARTEPINLIAAEIVASERACKM